MNRDEARRLAGRILAVRFPRSWDQIDLERFPVANYIVFRDALGPSFETSRKRFWEARDVLSGHDIRDPIFMMDEEGGRVTQTSEFFQSAPSPRAVAKSLTPEEAGRLYLHLSAYLADLGISANLAPCLDVNTEALNPIIGTRAFGATSELVSSFARRIVPAMGKLVTCVAKHFPGHGMTTRDSHLGLPVVEESLRHLRDIHIAPFKEAISAGVDGIMVSHCLYTSLQTEYLPASLDQSIVRGYLREQLGFSGVVLTDSLDMQAVTTTVSATGAAHLAIEAGCDLILYTEMSERFMAAFETVVEMAAMGVLREDRLMESAHRLANWRSARRWKAANAIRACDESRRDAVEFDIHSYLDLLYRARAGSIRVTRGQAKLPLAVADAALVATSPAIAGKLRPHIAKLAEIAAGDDLAGRPLILWLAEPLFLKQSLDDLGALAARAPISILVTTYRQIADEMKDADVVILSDDTSPHAEDAIVELLFGHAPARQ
jgi:beta-glucosidase-like glycosyl hydrolase